MSTLSGRVAEDLAAEYLCDMGHRVLHRNVRTRWSEIDLITMSQGAVHFVEVKYRSNAAYGIGVEYITADKVRRLRRAAHAWMSQYGRGEGYQVDIISVGGSLEQPTIEYIPCVVMDE